VLDAETVRSDLRHFWRRLRPAAAYAPESPSSPSE
jgi:hypothetical protein